MFTKKYILVGTLFMSLLINTYNSHAETNIGTISTNIGIPTKLAKSIRSAFYTHDNFIINAVANAAKTSNPQLSSKIENYLEVLKKEDDLESVNLVSIDNTNSQELHNLAPAAGNSKYDAEKVEKNWKGSLELGASFATGNTEEQTARVEGDFEYIFTDRISNITKFSTSTNKNNDVRTEEEYRINNQTKYNLTDKNYSFVELEYINDRFSGQDYRISELVGFGREIYKDDKINLTAEASIGARQTKETGQSVDNSILAKIGGDFNWKITDTLKFGENLTVSTSTASTITKSSSFIKSDLTETLYLKFGVDLEHISEVPAGKENLDTVTKLTVGYDF